jgi:hypothetical protein
VAQEGRPHGAPTALRRIMTKRTIAPSARQVSAASAKSRASIVRAVENGVR